MIFLVNMTECSCLDETKILFKMTMDVLGLALFLFSYSLLLWYYMLRMLVCPGDYLILCKAEPSHCVLCAHYLQLGIIFSPPSKAHSKVHICCL